MLFFFSFEMKRGQLFLEYSPESGSRIVIHNARLSEQERRDDREMKIPRVKKYT